MTTASAEHHEPEMTEFELSEKRKWDALNAHMTPQFEGIKIYVEHCMARYRVGYFGNPNAIYVPDPDVGEMKALTGHSLSPETQAKWRKFKNRPLKEMDPELFERIVEQQDNLVKTVKECGVKVIRNEECEYPDGVLNYNDSWGGPKFLSLYGTPGKTFHNLFTGIYDCGPVRTCEFSIRQGMMKAFENNPDLRYWQMPFPEPDVNIMGPGSVGIDYAGVRLLPGKHILFGIGIPDAKYIPSTYDPETCNDHTAAGTPIGAKFMMERMMSDLGYTYDIVFFDSNLTYHHDCHTMNMKEGIIGMPEGENYGHFNELPEYFKDWQIIEIPHDEIEYGVANAIAIGDGRVICDDRAKVTHERMYAAGLDPIPLPYDALWDTYNSGMQCSDGSLHRED